MVKYYGRARQRIGSVNTNQLGLKMSGCPSKVGRSGRIDRYISRRSHCGIVFCGWVWYHGIKWKQNHWVNPYTKEINWRCIPAAPITRALAGGVGRLNAPRFRCAKDCGRHPWWNWTNNPHSSPRAHADVEATPLPPAAWTPLPTIGLTPRFVDPNWPAYSATLGAPYYPTTGLQGTQHGPRTGGVNKQVVVLGGLIADPNHDSKVAACKAVDTFVYVTGVAEGNIEVCSNDPDPDPNPPTPTWANPAWVKGNTKIPANPPGNVPDDPDSPPDSTPPTGTGVLLTTPRAGLAAVWIALPTKTPVTTEYGGSAWGVALPSLLAIGGWNGKTGTLNTCEVIPGGGGLPRGDGRSRQAVLTAALALAAPYGCFALLLRCGRRREEQLPTLTSKRGLAVPRILHPRALAAGAGATDDVRLVGGCTHRYRRSTTAELGVLGRRQLQGEEGAL